MGTTITGRQIRDESLTGDDVKDGSLTAADFAPEYKDGNPSLPCLRTLGTGPNQAAPGNHTHDGGGSSLSLDLVIALIIALG